MLSKCMHQDWESTATLVYSELKRQHAKMVTMLMILLAEKLKDHESYYSSYRGDMIVCTKCHCNSSNSSQDFFFTQKNKCQSHEEIQGKIFKIHALGTMNVCT